MLTFKLTPNADKTQWTVMVLYSFCAKEPNCADGNLPAWGLTMDAAGNLYGTTQHGGAHAGTNGDGTIYALRPNADKTQWTYTVLYNFCGQPPGCQDGSFPQGALTMDTAGNLYGVTNRGGSNNSVFGTAGTVFVLTPNADKTQWTETVLYNFCALNEAVERCIDGAVPSGGVIMDTAGNLYGTTEEGGAHMTLNGYTGGAGTVYRLTPNADKTQWTETVLYSFCAQPNCADGYVVFAGLVMDAAGNLYGTTSQGGSGGPVSSGFTGTAFELTPNADKTQWTYTVLHDFCVPYSPQTGCSTDGYNPDGGLIMDTAGNLYGTTGQGGPGQHGAAVYQGGTVFKLAPNADKTQWTHTVLYGFCAQSGCTDGLGPAADLMADGEGNLYGVTGGGGNGYTSSTNGYGTVFKLTGSGFTTPIVLPPSEVATTASGLAYSRVSRTFNGTVTITNISGAPISGPFSISFTGLPPGVTLVNATGEFSGAPYLTVFAVSGLATGQSANVTVQFKNPSYTTINLRPVVYSGSI
jgi:uncharacterized membrane protein